MPRMPSRPGARKQRGKARGQNRSAARNAALASLIQRGPGQMGRQVQLPGAMGQRPVAQMPMRPVAPMMQGRPVMPGGPTAPAGGGLVARPMPRPMPGVGGTILPNRSGGGVM